MYRRLIENIYLLMLKIADLNIKAGNKEVVRDFSLEIRAGEIHALMGPNGSGKSSLAFALAGHPDYEVVGGSIEFNGKNILGLASEERARHGLFLSFQEPPEVGGVSLNIFLKTIAAKENNPEAVLTQALPRLGLADSFLARFLNEGFSGGEKRKSEILQFLARQPKIAVFDEIDSGLDVDSLRGVAEILKKSAGDGTGILVISHTQRLLEKIQPDKIHILIEGRKICSGGMETISELEKHGYRHFINKLI